MSAQPGTQKLLDHLLTKFYPGTFSLGIYNPASKNDDGTPSLHAEGRALDLGVTVGSRDLLGPGEQAFWWLYERREELDLLELRWAPAELERGRIWTLRRDGEGVRDDSVQGTADHRSHVHCGQGVTGAAGLSEWYQEEDELTPEQWAKIEEWGRKTDELHDWLGGRFLFMHPEVSEPNLELAGPILNTNYWAVDEAAFRAAIKSALTEVLKKP